MIQIEDIRCPISLQIFAEPVIAEDGVTYERDVIKKWIQEHKYSPTTKEAITDKFIPNKSLKSIIDGLLLKHERLREQQFTLVNSYSLHIAAIQSAVDNSQFDKLLTYVDYDMSNDALLTSIFEKCKDNNIIRHIIDNFVGLESENKSRWRLVHFICSLSTPEMIKYIVSKGVDLECTTGNSHCRPIHFVCNNSTPDVIKYMIDKGVNLECADKNGFRPIHYVCQHSTPDVIKYMIDKGVDLDCANNAGDRRPIHCACYSSTPDVIKYIIDKGADLECADQNGTKPIHYACQHSTPEIIKYMIDKGVDLECATKTGEKPIHMVCEYSTPEIIKYMIRKGVDLESATNARTRPIHIICKQSTPYMIRYMVSRGINLECENKEGWRPIHFICQYSSLTMIKFMVSKGVNLESVIHVNGWRPIHILCYYGGAESIKYLVEKGVELHHMIDKFYDNKRKMSVVDLIKLNRVIDKKTRSMLLDYIEEAYSREKLLNEMTEQCASLMVLDDEISCEHISLVKEWTCEMGDELSDE